MANRTHTNIFFRNEMLQLRAIERSKAGNIELSVHREIKPKHVWQRQTARPSISREKAYLEDMSPNVELLVPPLRDPAVAVTAEVCSIAVGKEILV